MGNQQSAPAPRRPPNRLTKPRTNNSAPNLLTTASCIPSQLSLPLAPKKRFSTLDINVVEDAQVPTAPAATKRRSLFRSRTTVAEILPPLVKTMPLSDIEGVEKPYPIHRHSQFDTRASEMLGETLNPLHDNQRGLTRTSSASYLPYSQQPSRLSFVVEARSPYILHSDIRGRANQATEGGMNNEWDWSCLPPTERTNSDESDSFPIRRRSLLTPGVATRGTQAEQPYREPAPTEYTQPAARGNFFNRRFSQNGPRFPARSQTMLSEDELRQYYYNPSKPISSPLEQLAALEPPLQSLSYPRTLTPTELDYGCIGSHKLGSLRITNGAASPGLSIHESNAVDDRSLEGVNQNDYITAPESLHNEGESQCRRRYDHNTRGFLKYAETPSNLRVSSSQYGDHPAAPTREAPSLPTIVPASETDAEMCGDEPLTMRTPTRGTPDKSLALFNFYQSPTLTIKIDPQSPTRAREMAEEYMKEIPTSPFSFDQAPLSPFSFEQSPRSPLMSTSKNTAAEDHLFDDEAVSTLSHSTTSERIACSPTSLTNAENTNSMVDPVPTSHTAFQAPRKAQPPLSKADSGYSSNASIRSIKSYRSLHEARRAAAPLAGTTLPDKSAPPTPPKDLYAGNSHIAESSSVGTMQSSIEDHPPETPPKDNLDRSLTSTSAMQKQPARTVSWSILTSDMQPQPSHAFRQTPPVPLKHSQTEGSMAFASLFPAEQRQAGQHRPQAEPMPRQSAPDFRQSMPANFKDVYPIKKDPAALSSTSGSDVSTASSSQRPPQQRRASQPEVTGQSHHEIEMSGIPAIPKDVSAKLQGRLLSFHDFTPTYKKLHYSNSKETLATILSMGSAEYGEDVVSIFSRYDGALPETPSSAEIDRSIVRKAVPAPVQNENFYHQEKVYRRKSDQPESLHSGDRTMSFDSSVRRRSLARNIPKQTDFETHITSFGNVSKSLGASPYDAALTAMGSRSRSGSQSSIAPHSMGDNGMARGRAVGMDSAAASHFARERSRIREIERRRSISRRQSYEGRSSFGERSLFPERIPRPNALVERVPSLPQMYGRDLHNSGLLQRAKQPPPPVSMATRKGLPNMIPQPRRPVPPPPTQLTYIYQAPRLQC